MGGNYPSEGRTSDSKGVALPAGGGEQVLSGGQLVDSETAAVG